MPARANRAQLPKGPAFPATSAREPAEFVEALDIRALPLLLRATDIARLLGVGRQRIYDLVECGDLHALRLGKRGMRIFRESLSDYLKRSVIQ